MQAKPPHPRRVFMQQRRCSATCCGGFGRYRCRPADARPECNEVRLAKKEHRCGAVSEGCPESGGSSRFHVERGFNRERRNVR